MYWHGRAERFHLISKPFSGIISKGESVFNLSVRLHRDPGTWRWDYEAILDWSQNFQSLENNEEEHESNNWNFDLSLKSLRDSGTWCNSGQVFQGRKSECYEKASLN